MYGKALEKYLCSKQGLTPSKLFEWCFDWSVNYPTTAQSNYTGPASGSARIVRGGYYNYTADYLQVGVRHGYSPYIALSDFGGFRFARTN
jgi:formylglycine-generating enzyme required for sulfatase activity